MATTDEGFQKFLAWVQAFNEHQLTNETEVETKFILPLFALLGYPDDCRRQQYSLRGKYELGKRGNKPRIDQIYFSSSKSDEQTPDTALVIVEAKAPQILDLDEALEQARFYGDRMEPLFLVVTNGLQLRVIKRHRYRSEEMVLNTPVSSLCEQAEGRRVFELLQFDVLKRLKAQLIDPVPHAQYVELLHAMECQPDLRAQLARGDFAPGRTHDGTRLTVITPKVAIECEVPVAFGDGNCRISFSSLLLRGLTCHLSHRQILETLLTGLGTPAGWGTRRFLRRGEGSDFEASLGQTNVLLSAQEADDLCACVDAVGRVYKEMIVSAEDVLETWDYLRRSLLLSVQPWLWELMHRFAREFDFMEGSSRWHMFDANNVGFRVMTRRAGRSVESAELLPHYGSSEQPKREVDVLYCMEEDRSLESFAEHTEASWKQAVGPNGRWTARYTEQWLIKQFIPQVLKHYGRLQKPGESQPYWQLHTGTDRTVLLAQVSLARDFGPYLHRIQAWFHIYDITGDCHIPAESLRPFYAALTDLVHGIDPVAIAPRYVWYIEGYATRFLGRESAEEPSGEEQLADTHDEAELNGSDEEKSSIQGVATILAALQAHVSRIRQADYEHPRVADFVISAFIGLVEHGDIDCTQEQLNATAEALRPLLEECRFEERYVLRPPWE